MKAYPVIYSRTRLAEYSFLVKPDDLDTRIASPYVTAALENIKYTDGLRHVVFSVGNYFIYGGAACIMSHLVKRILQSQEIDFPYRDYQADKAGRPLIFFIGFAIHKSDLRGREIPKLNLYDTCKIYLKYLQEQWNKDKTDTVVPTGMELPTRTYIGGTSPKYLSYDGKHFLEDYSEADYQRYMDYFFMEMVKNPAHSFISNVLPDDIHSKFPFTNMSVYGCSAEKCVERLNSQIAQEQRRFSSGGGSKASPSDGQSLPKTKQPVIKTSSRTSDGRTAGEKKTDGGSGLKKAMVLLVLLLAIFVLILLLQQKAMAASATKMSTLAAVTASPAASTASTATATEKSTKPLV